MDRFSKEVVEPEHCEPMRSIIVHNELVIEEERTEDIRKVEDDALGLGWVRGLRYICLYVGDLLLMPDWSTRMGDSSKTVLTELRGHAVSGMR